MNGCIHLKYVWNIFEFVSKLTKVSIRFTDPQNELRNSHGSFLSYQASVRGISRIHSLHGVVAIWKKNNKSIKNFGFGPITWVPTLIWPVMWPQKILKFLFDFELYHLTPYLKDILADGTWVLLGWGTGGHAPPPMFLEVGDKRHFVPPCFTGQNFLFSA